MTGGALLADTILTSGDFVMTGGLVAVGGVTGDLDVTDGTVAPGASAGVTDVQGDLLLRAGSTLEIEIGGTDPSEFDRVVVGELAAIQGGLDVSLIDLGGGIFLPEPTDAFTVLTANSFFGAFTNVADGARLETSNGVGSFLVEYSPGTSTVVLSDFLAAELTADIDNDGDVDGADFLEIQRMDLPLISDWESQFGSSSSLNGAATAVPEPTGALLVLLAAVLMGGRVWKKPMASGDSFCSPSPEQVRVAR